MVTSESLRRDLLAGLIGAFIVTPQAVAFATLAGLPPQYGLYCAMVPAVVAALWGSSWHLVSGPTNAISLVVLATVSPLAEPGSAHYVNLVLLLSLIVGVMQLLMGLARLGTVVNFISHTVVVGFTAGAAVLIIASQLRNFFGVEIRRGASFAATLGQFWDQLPHIEPYVTAVGLSTLLAALAGKRWLPRIPYMILAMIVGSLVALGLDRYLGGDVTHIKTLGPLPGALPTLSVPDVAHENWRNLVGIALAIAALGLAEAVSIARSVAVKSGQRIDGNQEFIGQGLSNIAGAFFSAFPSSGSFNRTGLNYEAGAKTPLAAVFASAFLVLVLLGVAPLAAYLPIASMAAVLFLVAWGLFDLREISKILRVSRSETLVLLVTFLATLVMHLEFAILSGVLLSLMLYLQRTSRPHIRSLMPVRGDPERSFEARQPGNPECPQFKLVRIEGSLYFGAVNHVAEYLHDIAERRPEQKHLLLACKSMNFVDVAGAELLAREARRRRDAGGSLYLFGLRDSASRMFGKAVYAGDLRGQDIFTSRGKAVATIVGRLDHGICARCKLRVFDECSALPGGERHRPL
jgi:SulP family sulfate permease